MADEAKYVRCSTRVAPNGVGGKIALKMEERFVPLFLHTVTVIDISREAVRIEGFRGVDDKSYQIEMRADRFRSLERTGRVCRKSSHDDNGGWTVFKFDAPLNRNDLFVATGGQSEPICPAREEDKGHDFAKNDKQLLVNETHHIKTCRSNIFIWTVGFMVAGVPALFVAIISGKLSLVSILLSMTGFYFVLLLSMLSVIEKARALNIREGFIAAVDHYLTRGQSPPNYQGWVQMKQCLAECGARRRAEICPRNIAIGGCACKDEAFKYTHPITNEKYTVASILDSFSTLVSTIYIFAFICIATAWAISILMWFNEVFQVSTSPVAFIGSMILGPIVWRFRKLLLPLMMLSMLAIPIAVCALYKLPLHTILASMAAMICELLAGVFVGSTARFFARKFREVQKGKYSFECFTRSWFIVFAHFQPLLADSTVRDLQKAKTWWGQRVERMSGWLLDAA